MVLPRMELHHIGHWLKHLHRHGMNKVWIYCEPGEIYDNCYSDEKTMDWKKKPEADYNLQLSSKESIECIRRIAAQADIDVDVRISNAKSAEVGGRQHQVGNSLLQEVTTSQKGQWDWLIFLDVDEYLVASSKSVCAILDSIELKCSRVRMKQKVFHSRWQNGQAMDVSRIGENYGICDFNHKYFFRPSQLEKFGDVHNSVKALGTKMKIDPAILRFHHFRGSPDFAAGGPRLFGLPKYVRLKNRPAQPLDFSHND